MFFGVQRFFQLGVVLAAFASTNAAELREARVTQIVRDVKLLPDAAPARAAAVNDEIHNGTAVRTGIESRTELKFSDATLARLGANTIFSFTEGTRNLELTDGAMLLRVPKNAGGAKINTAAVTAAITGTTIMLEFHKNSYIKFIVLEGTGRIFIPNHVGESVLVRAGQMLITKPNAKNLPSPVDVDIGKLRKTSRLIRGFGKMGSEDLIAQTEADQNKEQANGELYETNLAIYGAGTDVILTDPTHTLAAEQQIPPPPGQFGPPETIPDPDAYPLGVGAQINTGPPTIVSDGITHFGKIYRTTLLDGTRSLWFFRSTRPFDTASGFDTPDRTLFDLNYIATFKFQDLALLSNPNVSVSQGGITKLALIGVGSITSGPPGGSLTFTGLDSVLLATQNGSINLANGISFLNIPNLFFYARGASVSLTLGSPINGSNNLLLNSEGTLQINGNISVSNLNAFLNGDFLEGSGLVTAHDITINSIAGNVTFDAGKFPDVAGGTINLTANSTLTFIPTAGPIGRASIAGQGNTIDIVSSGPFAFDFNNSNVSFTAGEGGIHASNIDFAGSNLVLKSQGDISLLGSQVPLTKDGIPILSGSIDALGSISASGTIEISDLKAGHDLHTGSIYAGSVQAGGNITSANGIDAIGGSIVAGGNIESTNGFLRLSHDSNDAIGNINSGGSIFAGRGIVAPADSTVVAAGDIFAPQLVAGTLTAGGNITVDNSSGQVEGDVLVNTIKASMLSLINTSRVSSIYVGGGSNAFSPGDFTMTVGSISSTGPAIPILFANGVDAPSMGSLGPGSGGNVTLNLTGDGLVVAPDGDFASITADGGRFIASGPFTGGNGGVVNVTAAGPIEVDAPIEATTGYLQSPFDPHGNGGTVNLTSTNDSVSVSSRIEVSSADRPSTKLRRRSATGGNIALKSGKPAGVAINLSNTSELLSLLDAAAPGPGGKVTILATGANSSANINGKIVADRGTIDIRHSGENGQIILGGSGEADHIEAHADVIKVATLGNNGVLTVGNGLLSADTTLKLYSPGNNGTVNFVADVTLSGAGTKIIAGNTVNIFNGVVVTINGGTPASVFTNNANYTGFGGNGSRTGTFTGAGAKSPLPLSQAPALDGPGG